MHRRAFLTSVGATGLLAAGGVLSACGSNGGSPIPSGDPQLNVLRASFELLRGEGQRFMFSLSTIDNQPVAEESVEVYVGDVDGEIRAGPFVAEVSDGGEMPRPVYRASVDLEEEGPTSLLVVAGDRYGESVLEVVDPERSVLPAPGDPAVPAQTPTTDAPGDAEAVCTRDPDCDMHEDSFADVVDDGRPALLLFATPAFCQTAVCGPVVDVLEQVRQSDSWGDVAFIHCEIFQDAGETVLPAVEEWGLPTEPWLFAVDRDGRIHARLDGPMLADELTSLAETLRG